jgi:hypothetical protein
MAITATTPTAMPAIAPPERPELELTAAEVVALVVASRAVVALVVVMVSEGEVERVLSDDTVEDIADMVDASAVAGAVAIEPVTVVVANKLHVPSAAQ